MVGIMVKLENDADTRYMFVGRNVSVYGVFTYLKMKMKNGDEYIKHSQIPYVPINATTDWNVEPARNGVLARKNSVYKS